MRSLLSCLFSRLNNTKEERGERESKDVQQDGTSFLKPEVFQTPDVFELVKSTCFGVGFHMKPEGSLWSEGAELDLDRSGLAGSAPYGWSSLPSDGT